MAMTEEKSHSNRMVVTASRIPSFPFEPMIPFTVPPVYALISVVGFADEINAVLAEE